MKRFNTILILVLMAVALTAQISHALRDSEGRHVIGRGFVVVTNDNFNINKIK